VTPAARSAGRATQTLTTTEAAVLALLAIEGENSGYDLLKKVAKAIGFVWGPAKSQLYTLLPRLVRDGLAESRHVPQERRPDKQVYRISDEGRRLLDDWLGTVEPNEDERFFLRLFVGGLATREQAVEHVEQFRGDSLAKLEVLRAIEPTNTRTGHDYWHYFLLRLGIERREHDVAWADWVLAELGAQEPSP
jgi:DNA-binding PadR family transcriptional regulator